MLGELDSETRSLYFEVILDVFPELPATHCSVHVGTYRGVSQRVRSNYSVARSWLSGRRWWHSVSRKDP